MSTPPPPPPSLPCRGLARLAYWCRTEPNRTEPNRTGPKRIQPNRAGPTGPNQTEPNRTEPNRPQESTRTEPSRTEPKSLLELNRSGSTAIRTYNSTTFILTNPTQTVVLLLLLLRKVLQGAKKTLPCHCLVHYGVSNLSIL